MTHTAKTALAAVIMATTAGISSAYSMPVLPVSYDMQNGEGGFFDSSYSGAGGTAVALSELTGGSGKLTDGVIANGSPVDTPDSYVGWETINPVIRFNFGGTVLINQILISFAAVNGAGDIAHPSSVTIGAVHHNIGHVFPDAESKFSYGLNNLGLSISSLDIQIFDGAGSWIMLSEVQFGDSWSQTICGCFTNFQADPPVPQLLPPERPILYVFPATSVPEPVTLGLLGAGLLGIGALRRRKTG